MKFRKNIAVILCTVIMTGVFGGCGKGEAQEEGQTEQQKGRWVEIKEELPAELEGWKLQRVYAVGDEVRLLASKQEGSQTVFREWAGKQDGFNDVTQEWLASIALDCGEWMEPQLLQDGNGTQYLYVGYTAQGEEEYKGHLWKGEGTQAVDITPEKWTVPDEEWGMYERLLGIAALQDGTLATVSYTGVDLLSGRDGSILMSEPVTSQYEDTVVSDGENVYLCTEEGSKGQIEKRRGGKGNDKETIGFPTDSATGTLLGATKDGTLVAGGSDGIFRLRAGEESWEKLLNGSETDFAMKDCWCIGLTALEDGSIYGLFRESGGGARLNKYVYDPDAVIEVTERLKLYTVYESSLLQQAAVMYHKEHPQVLIEIQYVYPAYYYDETDYNAVYQELNTMLMGEEAPDILVMDHLNMDSFIGKGLLADIGEVINPLEESGQLLTNITGAYVREDGSRYVVPLQFGFNMVVGRDIPEADMGSLETLAGFLSKASESYLGQQTVSELVDKFYPYFCEDIVKDKQLDKEALGERLEALKLIADNCGMIDAREKDERCYNVWELASTAKLAFNESTGFKDCMFPISMAEYIRGSFTAYENSFIPSLQTGICTKSPFQETAKDFLKTALSESVQNTDYYKGFPVNKLSLEKQCHEDRSEARAETSIEADGGEVDFIIDCYSDETADKLLALCESLNRPIREDEKIREVLTEALDGYLKGTQSKEDTIQKVEDGLKMYLAE